MEALESVPQDKDTCASPNHYPQLLLSLEGREEVAKILRENLLLVGFLSNHHP